MKPRILYPFLLALLLLAATTRADEAPAARKYFDWVFTTLDKTEADLPAIAKAADTAAEAFVNGKNLGVRGGVSMNEELGARAGGIVVYRCAPGVAGDAILYFFGTARAAQPDVKKLLETELADAEKLLAEKSIVIGVASLEQLKANGLLERAQKACTQLLDNHAPANDALFAEKDGKSVIPTSIVAHPIVGWTFTAEFFAACTRRGKTPAMYKSVMVDPEMARYKKYDGVKFHEDLHVEPQPAETLGKAYIKSVRATLLDISTAGWKNLAAACDRATGTLADGGKVYVFLFGHYPPYHGPGVLANDPNLFTAVNTNFKLIAEPGLADYVLAYGYCNVPGEIIFKNDAWADTDKLRAAGRGIAWIVAAYNFKAADLKPGEILIDQRWAEGDAAVKVKDYDVNICPPSGVVTETLLWSMTAEVWQDYRAYEASKKK